MLDLLSMDVFDKTWHGLVSFQRLDDAVESVLKSWETVRRVRERWKVTELEEDLSELLKLQRRVKDKVQQSESILELSSSFHLATKRVSAFTVKQR